MKTVVGTVAGLLLGCISGCGSNAAPDSESGADARASETETFYRASAETRSELGVTTWSAPVADGGGSIKGRDSSRAVIVELRRVAETNGDAHFVRYALKHGDQMFSMRMSLDLSEGAVVGVHMLENSFATSAEARHILDLLNVDLKTAPVSSPRSTPSAGATSQALALSPRDLTNDDSPDLTNCIRQDYATCPDGTRSVTPCKDLIQFQNTWSAQTAQTCATCDSTGNPTFCGVCSTFTNQSEKQQAAVNQCISEKPAQCCPSLVTNDDSSSSSSDPCSPPAQCWQSCGCGNAE